MEISITNNGTLSWGNPIELSITNAVAPDETALYQVIVYLEKVISDSKTNPVFQKSFFPNKNNEINIDLSPYITSIGTYKLHFEEYYYHYIDNVFGESQSNQLDELDKTIVISNSTIVTNNYYNIPMGNVQLSGNPIQIIVSTTAGKMSGKNKYRLLLKITCSSLLGSPFVEEIAPDSNHLAKFNISGLVDQPATYDFSFPPAGIITDHRPLELIVSIDTGESFVDLNGDRQENWNNLDPNTNSIRILKGKLRPHELALLNEVGQNFTTEYINKGRFLTHQPDNMSVAPTQVMKLWYLSRFDTYINAVWYCSVTQKTNYGIHTYNDLSGTFVLDPASGLLEFNVEPLFMGFKRTVSEEYPILSFKFWICRVDTGEVISESRTFIVDPTYYENTFNFLFVNPLSGIDCLRLTGEHTKNLNVESETIYQPVPIGAGTKIPGVKTASVTGQRAWEINSGYKSYDEMIALQDFLESKNCWMADPQNPLRLIPVLVEKDKFKLYDSQEDVHSIPLKISEAYR